MSWQKKQASQTNSSVLNSLSDDGNGHLQYNNSPVGNTISTSTQSMISKLSDINGSLGYNGVVVATSASASADPLYPGLLTTANTFNLFDKSRVNTSTRHDPATGNILTGGIETHAIPVKPGYTYTFNRGGTIGSGYSFYDSSGNYLTGATAVSAKAPSGAATLYVNIVTDVNTFMVVEGGYSTADYIPYTQRLINPTGSQGWYRSKWFNKTWLVLGDSISTGNGDGVVLPSNYATKPYHYLLMRDRFINVQNIAVSGYTVGNVYNNIVANFPSDMTAPDLITIMIGTNDHGFNTAIGAITDTPASTGSFYAVYRQLIETLLTKFPMASIGLITPIQRYNVNLGQSNDGNTANATGKTIRDYCDAVAALSKKYGFPVLDWYYNLGFSPYNTLQQNNFYIHSANSGTTSDGTHPNNAGHAIMAGKVGSFIETL